MLPFSFEIVCLSRESSQNWFRTVPIKTGRSNLQRFEFKIAFTFSKITAGTRAIVKNRFIFLPFAIILEPVKRWFVTFTSFYFQLIYLFVQLLRLISCVLALSTNFPKCNRRRRRSTLCYNFHFLPSINYYPIWKKKEFCSTRYVLCNYEKHFVANFYLIISLILECNA